MLLFAPPAPPLLSSFPRLPPTPPPPPPTLPPQSAEKALRAVTGPDPSVHFYGNAPCSHLAHVYPPAYQDKHDVYGVKVFFYRSQLIYSTPPTGGIPIRQASDHAWLSDTELPAYVSAEYHAAIEPFMFGP